MHWISVENELPNIDEYVLLYDGSLNLVYEGKLLPSSFYYAERSGYSRDIGEGCEITHWMPLPQPPKDKDESYKVAQGRHDFPISNDSMVYRMEKENNGMD